MVVKARLTAEEFQEVAERYGACELVRGEIVPVTRAGFNHSRIVANVVQLLGIWTKRSARGRVLGGDAGVITERDPDTVRGADIAYVSYARLPKGTDWPGFVEVPPELIVEVLGVHKSWRDAAVKTGEYFHIGVDRVWIVEPRKQQVHLYHPDRAPVVRTSEEVVEDTDILPDFSCQVAEFFTD